MKEILASLHSVAGVEGTFLCNLDGRVEASTCPEEIQGEALAKIAYALILGVRTAQTQERSPRSIYGTFENGRVVVYPFEKGLVVVMGSSSIKQLLLKAALDRVIKQLLEMKRAAEEPGEQRNLQVAAGKVRVDQAAIDAEIVEQWQKSTKGSSTVKQVELQTSRGKVAMFKIKVKKGLGETVEINTTALKELGLAEGETVVAKPVIRLSSEVEEFFG
jgi:predicted regulator of Ras-like GTPase activity (Roadblock/LC7/MglB family)